MTTVVSKSWSHQCKGDTPNLEWHFQADAELVSACFSHEPGETFLTDSSGAIFRLDRSGEQLAYNKFQETIEHLCWAETGSFGYGIISDNVLIQFEKSLGTTWELDLPRRPTHLATDPHGRFVICCLPDGQSLLYNRKGKLFKQLETSSSIREAQFISDQPAWIGTLEDGSVCCYTMEGKRLWQEKLNSSLGQLAIAHESDTSYVSTHNLGIRVLNASGRQQGSLNIEGTTIHVAVSYNGKRILSSNYERVVSLLEASGKVRWSAESPDTITQLALSAYGNRAIIAFHSGTVQQICW